MNADRALFYLASVLLIAAIAFVVVQQRTIRRLTQEVASLRLVSEEATKVRADNAALRADLQRAEERTEPDRRELLKLRGQVAALRDKEKEIATLKSERERVTQQLQNAPSAPAVETEPEETPQQRFIRARASFSKNIGLALVMFAQANQERLPESLDVIDPKSFSDTPEFLEHNIQMEQFELTYKGRLNEAKDPSLTVLARERQPVQRADGQWEKTFVFVDGHVEVLSAASQEQLAQKEKEQFIVPTNP